MKSLCWSLSLREERAGKHGADGFGVFIPAEILPPEPEFPCPSDWTSRLVPFPDGCLKESVSSVHLNHHRKAVFTHKVHGVTAPVIKNLLLNEIKKSLVWKVLGCSSLALQDKVQPEFW